MDPARGIFFIVLTMTNNADCMLFSPCKLTACEVDNRMTTLNQMMTAYSDEMIKLVHLQHVVDKLNRGIHYQQQIIDQLQREVDHLKSDYVSDKNKSQPPSNPGRSDDLRVAVERLQNDTSRIDSQVSDLWKENGRLTGELARTVRRENVKPAKTAPFAEALIRHSGSLSNAVEERIKRLETNLGDFDSVGNISSLENAVRDVEYKVARLDSATVNRSEIEIMKRRIDEIGQSSSEVKEALAKHVPMDPVRNGFSLYEMVMDVRGRMNKMDSELRGGAELLVDKLAESSIKTDEKLKDIEESVGKFAGNVSIVAEMQNRNRKLLEDGLRKLEEKLRRSSSRQHETVGKLSEEISSIADAENTTKAHLKSFERKLERLNAHHEQLSDINNQTAAATFGRTLEKLKNEEIVEGTERDGSKSVQEIYAQWNKTRDDLVGKMRQEISSRFQIVNGTSVRDVLRRMEDFEANVTVLLKETLKEIWREKEMSSYHRNEFSERLNSIGNDVESMNETLNAKYDELLKGDFKIGRSDAGSGQKKKKNSTGQSEPLGDQPLTSAVDDYSNRGTGSTRNRPETDVDSKSKPGLSSPNGTSENIIIDSTEISHKSCRLKPPRDENVVATVDGLVVDNFLEHVTSGTAVYLRCDNIGEYELVGANKFTCHDGHWASDGHLPYCEQHTSEQTLIEMVGNKGKSELKCPKAIGTFPHPRECSQFLNCHEWRPVVMNCPKPLVYNPEVKGCSWKYTTDCSSRDSPKNIEKKMEKLKPSIYFNPKLGSSGLDASGNGKIYVYPGTSFEMHCSFPRLYGTPRWVVQLQRNKISKDGITYESFWVLPRNGAVMQSLRYGIRIDYAQTKDTGEYTCVTPSGVSKSVTVVVEAVDCPAIKTSDESLQIVGRRSTKMTANITFKCNSGTKLVGHSTIQCMPSGKWSKRIPTCLKSGQGGQGTSRTQRI